MDEIGADTFCERCGTRYSFSPTAPQTTLEKARFFARGFKHFVMNDGSSVDEAIQAARIEGGETVKAAEQFQKTFNFCMICRQYACEKCWNENQNACLSCAPLWDKPAVEPDDRLLNRTRAAHPGHAGRSGKAPRSRAGIEWPTEDSEVAAARTTGEPTSPPVAADSLIPPPVTAEELIPPPRPTHAPRQRSSERRVEEPAPFPFADDPVGLPQPDSGPQPGRPQPGSASAGRPDGSRTPSWVTQQEQAVVDELREKSQEWMARDDDWALWTSDEAPSRPPKPAAEMAPPPATPQAPARAPRQPRPEHAERADRHAAPEPAAPEPPPYEAPGLDQLAATRPANRDERIGGRSRTRQPEPAPAFEPLAAAKMDEDLIPPPAPARSRAGHSRNVAPSPGVPEAPVAGEVGFDLLGSLRQPVAPAGEPAPAETPKTRRSRETRERHAPVVGRILGGHRPADADVEQPARSPVPKASRAGGAASSKRAKDRQPSDETRWPTPTRWEDRPVAAEESPEFDLPAAAEMPPARSVFEAPPEPARAEPFAMPPASMESWTPIGHEPEREIVSPPEPRRRDWPPADAAPEPGFARPQPGVAWPRPSITPEPASTPVQWPPVTELWPPLPTEEEAPPARSASLASRQALEDGESPLVAELWAESARHVLDLGNARVCHGCGLPLSTHARFCRRCGASQD